MDPSLPVAPESRRVRRLDRLAPPKPVDIVLDRASLALGLELQTCPQCGVNPADPNARPRTLQYVSPWVYATFLLSLLVLIILYYVTRERLTTTIPLCHDCDKADRRGRLLTGLSYFGVFLAPIVLAIAGAPFDLAGEAAGMGFVAGVVGAVATTYRMRPQLVECRKMDKQIVKLRASPSWRAVLEREAPGSLRVGG